MSTMERPTVRVHREAEAILKPGDIAIDATAGNGHDTLFLARLVGSGGAVHAYDIQELAISSTRQRLLDAGCLDQVQLHLASHACMAEHVAEETVAVILFNLGYLPGADHEVITQVEETLAALSISLTVLRPGGLLGIVCYPGHTGGDVEAEAVLIWADALGEDFTCEVFRRLDTLRPAPFLVKILKKSVG
jgi:ubiquinone/menaquinone biosynthesis C-methylase UbiE